MTAEILTFPTVHLNGTSRDELLRQLLDADLALSTALAKLRQASPHARDYYVSQDPDAFKKARSQHDARCKAIFDVRNEIQQIAESL